VPHHHPRGEDGDARQKGPADSDVKSPAMPAVPTVDTRTVATVALSRLESHIESLQGQR
jgi:hypothetical protein